MSDSFVTLWIIAHLAPSILGISQARILGWVAISFSWDLPNPGIEPALARWMLYHWAIRKPSISVLEWLKSKILTTPHLARMWNNKNLHSLLGEMQKWFKQKWQPTPIFLPGRFHGQRSLAGYSPLGHKEPDMTKATSGTHEWYMTGISLPINFC